MKPSTVTTTLQRSSLRSDRRARASWCHRKTEEERNARIPSYRRVLRFRQRVEFSLWSYGGTLGKGSRQVGRTHEVLIHTAGGLTAFTDSPDNEGLAAAHV